MLRLDRGHPPLWRSPTSLQFGIAGLVRIDDPAPWQQRLVYELLRGVPDDAFEAVARVCGATPAQARSLLRRLAPVLAGAPAPRPVVTVQTPEHYPVDVADRVAQAVDSAGWAVARTTWYGAVDEAPAGTGPVIVIADHLIEPRRAAPLMARDIAHVPVVFTGGHAEIGPLIVPGRTACLACLGAHHRDADAAWPLLAAQLVGQPASEVASDLADEAGLVAARMLSRSGEIPRVAHSLTVRADSLRRTWRAHRPHEECLCRSPERSATETARAGRPRATTTSTAFAQPA